MDDLLTIEEKIDLEVRSLETCMYDHKTFSEILNRVQKAVDDLNLHSYSNLPIWVNKLDMEVRNGVCFSVFIFLLSTWEWTLLHTFISVSLKGGFPRKLPVAPPKFHVIDGRDGLHDASTSLGAGGCEEGEQGLYFLDA